MTIKLNSTGSKGYGWKLTGIGELSRENVRGMNEDVAVNVQSRELNMAGSCADCSSAASHQLNQLTYWLDLE